MGLDLVMEGKTLGEIKGDQVIFFDKDADINELLDQLPGGIEQVEDEWGNVLFNQVAPTINQKKIYLQEIGFILRKQRKKDTHYITKEPKEFIEADEANDYAEFLDKVFQRWLAQTLKFIDQTLEDELMMTKEPQVIEKTFGEFLQRLFNAINTAGFKNAVRLVIKKTMKLGIQDAEEELDQDIGFTADFDKEVNQQADRQLEGTLLSNGERWVGIKGVTRQVQQQISEAVKQAIDERRSIKDLKEDIRDLFGTYTGQGLKGGKGKVTEGRVMRIARTETNRLRSMAKLNGMKKAGIKFKTWDALNDKKTSAICERLEWKYAKNPAPIDEPFLDDTPMPGQVGLLQARGLSAKQAQKQAQPTYRSFQAPPAHVNCRSRPSASAGLEEEDL